MLKANRIPEKEKTFNKDLHKMNPQLPKKKKEKKKKEKLASTTAHRRRPAKPTRN